MKKSDQLLLQDSPEILKEKFYSIKTPMDIAALLGVSFDILIYHIYGVEANRRYKTLEIPKKTGGKRQIAIPITTLKIIQRKLNQVLQAVYQIKPSVHGFVKGKNIVTNAKVHSNKCCILNLDLKDFFASINFGRVRGVFMATPYELSPDVATILAQICCYNNYLPQGAPTSPIITNMICAKMDSQLQGLARGCNAVYTRYADDITFSTILLKFPEALAYTVTENDKDKLVLGNALLTIISENGFEVNEQKIRLQVKGNHQSVTGLTTNRFPNVDRNYVRQIRAMLHAWAKFGLEAAEKEYHKKYDSKERLPLKGKPAFKQVLRGKIEFLGMVKGKDDPIYRKFFKNYQKLLESEVVSFWDDF